MQQTRPSIQYVLVFKLLEFIHSEFYRKSLEAEDASSKIMCVSGKNDTVAQKALHFITFHFLEIASSPSGIL